MAEPTDYAGQLATCGVCGWAAGLEEDNATVGRFLVLVHTAIWHPVHYSLATGRDPADLVDEYGADAVAQARPLVVPPGHTEADAPFPVDRPKKSRRNPLKFRRRRPKMGP